MHFWIPDVHRYSILGDFYVHSAGFVGVSPTAIHSFPFKIISSDSIVTVRPPGLSEHQPTACEGAERRRRAGIRFADYLATCPLIILDLMWNLEAPYKWYARNLKLHARTRTEA